MSLRPLRIALVLALLGTLVAIAPISTRPAAAIVGPTTVRVSVSSSGAQGNGASTDPAIDGDGSAIVFTSAASNLAADPNSVLDVFVHDLSTGVTERVSRAPGACQAGCTHGSIEDSGNRIAYLDGIWQTGVGRVRFMYRSNGRQILIEDRRTLCGTYCEAGGNDGSLNFTNSMRAPEISGDGSRIVYAVGAYGNYNTAFCVVGGGNAIQRAVASYDGNVDQTLMRSCGTPTQIHGMMTPSPSDNAGRVAYEAQTYQTTNSGTCIGRSEIMVANGPTTTWGGTSSPGTCISDWGAVDDPMISGNGSWVVFTSNRASFVSDTNNVDDVFRMRYDGAAISRMSVSSGGSQGNGASFDPAISDDGRMVAFASDASNLVSGDDNGATDVFLKDWTTGAIERISTAVGGGDANGASTEPALSDDGCTVTFTSAASNLVNGDSNGVTDIFVRRSSLPVCSAAPTAGDDAAATVADQPVTIPVAANDTDPYGPAASADIHLVTGPADGVVTDGPGDGEMTFTPDPGFVGATSFTYEICNLTLQCDLATVAVTVHAVPVVTGGTATILEGDSGTRTVSVDITLDVAPLLPVTVDWSVGGGPGDAVAGVDYTAASGTVTFAPSVTTASVDVEIHGDLLDEGDPDREYGTVVLSDPTNAVLASGADGTFWIDDDDAAPVMTPGIVLVTEGDSGPTVVSVPVTLSAPSGKTIEASWETVDTLTYLVPGVDYVADSGSVTFLPGETSTTIEFTVLGDTVDEPGILFGTEWALVRFFDESSVDFAPGLFGRYASIFIADDD
ncbi:MAG: Calx-beta domain-containing protein [Acidimicrobiales bacterium]|nr:Calx-beta domain-containing protein [Acidimicrobiales bacterium]